MSIAQDSEQIYSIFPRKRDKRYALACIERAIKRLENGESGQRMLYDDCILFLLAAVQEFASSPAGRRREFVPYCATWMNRGAYLDNREEWQHLNREEAQEMRMRSEANIGVWNGRS